MNAVLQGKVGDLLFDGQWRFRVLSVWTPASYTAKTPDFDPSSDGISYSRDTRILRAVKGYKLIVIQCRMTNGQKSPQTFWLGHNDVRNALTDAEGSPIPGWL